MLSPESIRGMLVKLDDLNAIETKFDEARTKGGLAWAIEGYGEAIIQARQMARILRPILSAYDEMATDEWIAMIKGTRDDITRQLINGHWRHNSTNQMQNLTNQMEAGAMAKFLQHLVYIVP